MRSSEIDLVVSAKLQRKTTGPLTQEDAYRLVNEAGAATRLGVQWLGGTEIVARAGIVGLVCRAQAKRKNA